MSFEIPIVFQNEEIIVVDKPVGLSIHNTEDPTNLIGVLSEQLVATNSQFRQRKLFPVHRLDKETSGIQIFAFDEVAAAKHATAFQTRSVRKVYLGVLRGVLKDDTGTWSQPLTDKSEGRVNPAGLSKDRIPCETRFRVTRRSKFFTECEFDLITGRQHQIRKHAALAKHTLVGDPRYGDKKYNQRMAEMYAETRMYLHCSEIELLHRTFKSPTPAAFDSLHW